MPKNNKSNKKNSVGGASGGSAEEKRTDPHDGKEYTFNELSAAYKDTYTKKQITDYWNSTCTADAKKESEQEEPKASPDKAAAEPEAPAKKAEATPAVASSSAAGGYTLEEVAKHVTKEDCWIVLNGQVVNVTSFLPDHPGGDQVVLSFAGKDASEDFNMLHPPDTIEKYAPKCVIGKLATGSFAPAASGNAEAEKVAAEKAAADKAAADKAAADKAAADKAAADKAAAEKSAKSLGVSTRKGWQHRCSASGITQSCMKASLTSSNPSS